MESETDCKQLVQVVIPADSPSHEENSDQTDHRRIINTADAARWGSPFAHVQSQRVFVNLMTLSDSPNVSPIEGGKYYKARDIAKVHRHKHKMMQIAAR